MTDPRETRPPPAAARPASGPRTGQGPRSDTTSGSRADSGPDSGPVTAAKVTGQEIGAGTGRGEGPRAGPEEGPGAGPRPENPAGRHIAPPAGAQVGAERPAPPRRKGPRPGGRLALVLAILGCAVAGAVLLADHLGFETLRDNREAMIAFRDANYLAAVALFIAAYVAIVAFSLPGSLVASLTGGFLFGLFPGALFNVVAATLGAVAIFLAVRWGLGARLAARMEASEGAARQLRAALDENAFSAMLTVRLIPVVPFFVANLVPALVGMRLAPFATATFLGIIPGATVYTWVGAGLGEVFARDETPDLGLLFEPHVLGPLLGLAALAALPMAMRLMRRWR